MVAVRRALREDYLVDDPSRLNGIFGVAGTMFAVVLAFVVLSSFESYKVAEQGAEAEAVALLELARTADFLPPSSRVEFQSTLVCYARAVESAEWPAMRDGDRSPVVDDWVVALTAVLQTARLRTAAEKSAFGQLLGQQRERAGGRRERLAESVSVVPAPMWFILALGGIMSVGFVLLYADLRVRSLVQTVPIAIVAALVSAGLLVVWLLDHPYADGQGSIKPQELGRSVSIIEREQQRLAPPCDVRGLMREPA